MNNLIEMSQKYDEHKTDFLVGANQIQYDQDTCEMYVPAGLLNGVTPLTPTDWALQQLCTKLGPPPLKYMLQCPGHLRATNLLHWTRKQPDEKKWLVRASGNAARAVLSDRYSPISNTKMLEVTQEVLGDISHTLITPHLDADTLHLKVRMAATNGDDYGVGVYIGNGEIGNRKVRVLPFIQRNACTNSIIYPEGGFVQAHIHVTIAFIWGAVKEKMGQAFGVAAEMVERMVRAEMEKIPDLGDVIRGIVKQTGLSQEVQDNIFIGIEGKKTRAGLVNGLSYAASHGNLGIEAQINLETMAGAILAEEGSLFAMAARELAYAEEA